MSNILATLKAALARLPAGLRTFFVHMLTGKDNATFDVSRVLLLASGLTFLGLSIYHAIAHAQFDPTNFGVGAGAVLGGGAAGVAVKGSHEPDAEDK